MSAWVLIVILLGRSPAITQIDMPSERACNDAAGMMKLTEKEGWASFYVHTLCLRRD